jgi:hypothetical protein
MDKLVAIEAKIMATEEKLAKAEAAGDRDLTVAYLNYLTELQKEKSLLSTGTGNLL